MEMEAPMASKPTLHFGVLVRAVVVHDQMKVQVERKRSIELAEKLQKFLLAVARLAFSDHRLREHLEGCQ
jgi:hypothetical protein